MPFLGKTPGSPKNINVMLDAITTSATATYNLTKDSAAYTPKSAQTLLVSLNGVTQAPVAAYTVSGSTIVFASALTSTDVIDYIIVFEGDVTSITASDVGAGEIATSMLADDAVTAAKIADDAVVAAAIADDAITSALIADDAITSALIADDAVVQAAIADDAVDEARLQISNAGSNGQVLSKESGNTGGLTWITSGGLYSAWTIQTATLGSSEAAASGDQIICNHASTAIVITLPASPSNGDTVIIKNVGAATVTVGRAGNNINSVAADATMPVGNAAQLVFTGDATIGWTVL
jgi:hypothetical protein